MIKLLQYLISQGQRTEKNLFPDLPKTCNGQPYLTSNNCKDINCKLCEELCPTAAIQITKMKEENAISLDLGSCITCAECINICSSGTIMPNRSTKTAREERNKLILSNKNLPDTTDYHSQNNSLFQNDLEKNHKKLGKYQAHSIACRVVSTGCSACDLEIAAAGNPIFDMERFGISIVASPRFADVLLVTGPVPKAMHEPLLRCYEAMPEPRKVIAVGTCATSGGVHKNGYTEANGASNILPIDVFIPGCPPHPWSVIHGILTAFNRV